MEETHLYLFTLWITVMPTLVTATLGISLNVRNLHTRKFMRAITKQFSILVFLTINFRGEKNLMNFFLQ